MPNRPARWIACAAVLSLASCGGGDSLSRSFGLTKTAPDEFTVTTRAPLSMPPDLSLRPPRPGEARPQESLPSQSAEAALVPQAALGQSSGSDSPGQQALLRAAGPAAPADIRSRVSNDPGPDSDRWLADTLLFWKPATPPGTLVDPKAEAERLKQNAATGDSPQTGATPIIRRKNQSLFDSLF